MAFIYSGDRNDHALASDEAYRTYLITRRPQGAAAVHSGRTQAMRLAVHARHAGQRIDDLAFRAVTALDGFLHRAIEALARSKIRRIRRELALRGVRYDWTDQT